MGSCSDSHAACVAFPSNKKNGILKLVIAGLLLVQAGPETLGDASRDAIKVVW